MSGLDPMGRRDVRNAILRLRDAGQTVFFSSHILSDVEELCDRVCVLDFGKKIAEGTLSSLLTGKILEVALAFSGLPTGPLPENLARLARRTWHDGALLHVLVDSEETAQAVKAALEQRGATLRRMEPHKESLEEYFVRVTEERATGSLDVGCPCPGHKALAANGKAASGTRRAEANL
jgi:ABC-2 type transport system ATP-binding protein